MMTLFNFCSRVHDSKSNLLIARNLGAAIAELHALNIVHGDLASENILVNEVTSEVKLIDFDLASIEHTEKSAGGNPDFITTKIAKLIKSGKKMKSSKQDDLYALALCCYLIVAA